MTVSVCLSSCLSVCLSANISLELQISSAPNFLCMLPVAVARSSSGGVTTPHVLPVLWMTSCLHKMARNERHSSDSVGSSVDLSLWRILKGHHGSAADRLAAWRSG